MTGLLMSEGESRGVQAYRWFVAIGIAAVTYIGWDTKQAIRDTAADVVTLKVQVSALTSTVDSRLNAQADRLRSIDDKNTQQDGRMDRLSSKIDGLSRQIYEGFATHQQQAPP